MIQMDDLLKTMQLENAKAGFWSQDQDGIFCSPHYYIIAPLRWKQKKQKQKPNTDIKTHFRIPKTKNKVY